MRTIFTDAYQEQCEIPFKLDRAEVTKSFISPARVQKILTDGLEIRLYLKKFNNYYLLVQTRIENNNFLVEIVIKLKDATNNLLTKEPLIVLQDFIVQYGLELIIGNRQNKFIYNDFIPVTSNSSMDLIKINNPDNHHYCASFLHKTINKNGQKFVQCALAYCIDIDRYVESIK